MCVLILFIQQRCPSSALADASIRGLLLDVLYSGGTTAEAAQSLLVVALELRHQDYFFPKGGSTTEHQRTFSTNEPTSFLCISREVVTFLMVVWLEVCSCVCGL